MLKMKEKVQLQESLKNDIQKQKDQVSTTKLEIENLQREIDEEKAQFERLVKNAELDIIQKELDELKENDM